LKADLGQRLLVTFGPKSDRKRKVGSNHSIIPTRVFYAVSDSTEMNYFREQV
jgi:hypothetical protein